MEYKKTLKNQAIEINNLLSVYVDLHDKILKESGTFSSLFKKIEFKDIYNETKNIDSLFSSKKEDLNSLEAQFSENTPQQYKQYFMQLSLFFQKLYRTIELLKRRQYLLLLISEGEKHNMKEYKEIDNEYKRSVKIYMGEGAKLNNLNHIIFD